MPGKNIPLTHLGEHVVSYDEWNGSDDVFVVTVTYPNGDDRSYNVRHPRVVMPPAIADLIDTCIADYADRRDCFRCSHAYASIVHNLHALKRVH